MLDRQHELVAFLLIPSLINDISNSCLVVYLRIDIFCIVALRSALVSRLCLLPVFPLPPSTESSIACTFRDLNLDRNIDTLQPFFSLQEGCKLHWDRCGTVFEGSLGHSTYLMIQLYGHHNCDPCIARRFARYRALHAASHRSRLVNDPASL
jgi:hypothetical protein